MRRASMMVAVVGLAVPMVVARVALAQEAAVVVPQLHHRVVPHHGRPSPWGNATLAGVDVDVKIAGQVATTTLTLKLRNHAGSVQEAKVLMPVPEGSIYRGFSLAGAGNTPGLEGKILPRDEARKIYEEIVRRQRDPGLVEFMGTSVISTSVFPIPAATAAGPGTQDAVLVYEQILTPDGNRFDYVLPRSQAFEATGMQWNYRISIAPASPVIAVYSASHDIATTRPTPSETVVTLSGKGADVPGSFRLSYTVEPKVSPELLSHSILAYPDPDAGGGYFMLMAGLPAGAKVERTASPNEVTVVIDRSGSMQGVKIEQAKKAALQVIDALPADATFNIIDYSDSIQSWNARPTARSAEALKSAREYIGNIKAMGGTNIRDALLEAVRPEPAKGSLPMILFLTDGLPTVGERSEVGIRDQVAKANTHDRRIFTFGVGLDVNAPLLTALADKSRGATTFVLPDEDIETKVAQVYRRLCGPVLAGPELAGVNGAGEPEQAKVRDILPPMLPDVFEGDQIVVVGRYTDSSAGPDGRVRLRLSGTLRGQAKTWDVSFKPSEASARHGHVARLWATRKIGWLLDAVRLMGADKPSGWTPANDPAAKELIGEIVRISTRFGILTEYTAFLATETTTVAMREEVARDLATNLDAVNKRSAGAGVAQSRNDTGGKYAQQVEAAPAAWYNEKQERVQVGGRYNVSNDLVFYRRGGKWMDSRLVQQISDKKLDEAAKPDEVVEFASDEYFALAAKLTSEGRQALLTNAGQLEVLVNNKRVQVNNPQER